MHKKLLLVISLGVLLSAGAMASPIEKDLADVDLAPGYSTVDYSVVIEVARTDVFAMANDGLPGDDVSTKSIGAGYSGKLLSMAGFNSGDYTKHKVTDNYSLTEPGVPGQFFDSDFDSKRLSKNKPEGTFLKTVFFRHRHIANWQGSGKVFKQPDNPLRYN